MARPLQDDTQAQEAPGFDVLCVVGRVTFGGGKESPTVAAMKLIGEHGAEGVYSFPMEDGRLQEVTIAFVSGTTDNV